MQLSRSTEIDAGPQVVWDVITDIQNASSRIRGIDEVEILEAARGPSILGLKWRETRTMMGREATEVMWITEAAPLSHYVVRAESHGAVYDSRISIEPISGGSRLTMTFEAVPVTLLARILSALTGWMAKNALAKTIEQDLADIKAAAEQDG